MKEAIKRLFCLHLNWKELATLHGNHYTDSRWVSLSSGVYLLKKPFKKNRKTRWQCENCGKVKVFKDNSTPPNFSI